MRLFNLRVLGLFEPYDVYSRQNQIGSDGYLDISYILTFRLKILTFLKNNALQRFFIAHSVESF